MLVQVALASLSHAKLTRSLIARRRQYSLRRSEVQIPYTRLLAYSLAHSKEGYYSLPPSVAQIACLHCLLLSPPSLRSLVFMRSLVL